MYRPSVSRWAQMACCSRTEVEVVKEVQVVTVQRQPPVGHKEIVRQGLLYEARVGTAVATEVTVVTVRPGRRQGARTRRVSRKTMAAAVEAEVAPASSTRPASPAMRSSRPRHRAC